jgi:hypothetical protein
MYYMVTPKIPDKSNGTGIGSPGVAPGFDPF